MAKASAADKTVSPKKPQSANAASPLSLGALSSNGAMSEEEFVRIAARAYQLWEERGFVHGHDLEDWLQAEGEIRGQ
jgi:hypothetical protein